MQIPNFESYTALDHSAMDYSAAVRVMPELEAVVTTFESALLAGSPWREDNLPGKPELTVLDLGRLHVVIDQQRVNRRPPGEEVVDKLLDYLGGYHDPQDLIERISAWRKKSPGLRTQIRHAMTHDVRWPAGPPATLPDLDYSVVDAGTAIGYFTARAVSKWLHDNLVCPFELDLLRAVGYEHYVPETEDVISIDIGDHSFRIETVPEMFIDYGRLLDLLTVRTGRPLPKSGELFMVANGWEHPELDLAAIYGVEDSQVSGSAVRARIEALLEDPRIKRRKIKEQKIII